MDDDRMELRWGFVAPGRIANLVARDLPHVDGAVLHAVASRSIDRAQAFAREHGAAVAYGSYGELLADREVDVVYVATPHRQHHAVAMAAIAEGKHLLVEKAFTCTLAGAHDIVEAARAAGVFCMEAMWTRFQPAIAAAARAVNDGRIGDVRSVRADLGLRTSFDAANRLWDPLQGGGALLDLGVYPVSFVQSVLGGVADASHVAGTLAGNGVDAESVVLWRDAAGRTGMAQSSLLSPLPGVAAIFGTDGWIEVPPRFHHPDHIVVHAVGPDGRAVLPERIDAPATGAGYAHELAEVHRCIAAGRTESPVMPLDDTLAVMAVLDRALHDLGVHHDEDDTVPL